MTSIRTPFKVGQSIDDVLYVMKRTNRRRLAVQFEVREGTLFINLCGKRGKHVSQQLYSHAIDLKQNMTTLYYLSDCTLKFKRYRGLDGKGADCYRVVHIGEPVNVKDRQSSFTPRGQAQDQQSVEPEAALPVPA